MGTESIKVVKKALEEKEDLATAMAILKMMASTRG